jgi:hypothetical protein
VRLAVDDEQRLVRADVAVEGDARPSSAAVTIDTKFMAGSLSQHSAKANPPV